MNKAKAAVEGFMHKAGHHDTTVHEKVAPAVTDETIQRTKHLERTTAVDKEIHQDHHHTSVQPVKDREVLPEEHHHRMGEVEHRHHNHGNAEAIKAKLEQEKAQFQHTRREVDGQVTESAAPVVAGEHVHHHVHETIQPVIQKETIQPSVIHETVPVHEVHHNEARHHAASALPAVSMHEFRQQGGVLSGREERVDGFEGEPKPVGSTLGGGSAGGILSGHQNGSSTTSGSNGYGTDGTRHNTAGPHDSNLANKADPRVDSDGSRNGQTSYGTDGVRNNAYNDPNNSGTGRDGLNGSANNTGPHNSKLANKVDPRVDSDRDGKVGVGE